MESTDHSDLFGGLDPSDVARLRRAAVVALNEAWHEFNETFAGGLMTSPEIALAARTSSTLGAWYRSERRIRLSEQHVFGDRWCDVLATLRHEMAHQYADTVLGAAADEGPHGPTFKQAAEVLRADASAHVPRPPAAESATDRHPLLGRLRKLLALGRSPHRHEAEAALAKARALMRAHELDEVAVLAGDKGALEGFAMADVGPIRKRHDAWRGALSNLLRVHFGVRCLWVYAYDAIAARHGRVLRLFGRRDRLEFAEYVHDWIVDGVLEQLWVEDRQRRGERGNRDRRVFYEGVVRGFHQTLVGRSSERACAETASDSAAVQPSSRDLLAREEARLDSYLHRYHPRIQTRRTSGTSQGADAYARGLARGRDLRLHRPVSGGDEVIRRLPGGA